MRTGRRPNRPAPRAIPDACAGCSSSRSCPSSPGAAAGRRSPTASTPAPTATPREDEHELEGYSEGVKKYYGGAHVHEDDAAGNIEAEYHQPPKPAETDLGGTIELTGTEIGVRFDVTVTDVKPVDEDLMAVYLKMVSTGITVYEGPMSTRRSPIREKSPRRSIRRPAPSARTGSTRSCGSMFFDRLSGCLLFPRSGDAMPDASSSRSKSSRPRPAGSGYSARANSGFRSRRFGSRSPRATPADVLRRPHKSLLTFALKLR